jgi:two-component system chemotaxis response regulator CheB
VLVVEDSPTQLVLVLSILRAAGAFEIVGTATNGRDAVAATKALHPQVLAMDIHLPIFDGYEATRQIMQQCPTPIVLMSSSAGDADRRSLDALAAGALTVVRKPGNPLSPNSTSERDVFVRTLRLMAGVRVVTRHAPRQPLPRIVPPSAARRPIELLAIATSTGGPAALQTVLHGLGADLPTPVLIVQHIANGFTKALIDWLAGVVPQPLALVERESALVAGHVYFAAENRHLTVRRKGIAAPRDVQATDRYVPSADVLFQSVAECYGGNSAGVILTGMGDDGVRGLSAMAQAGAITFGQDAATCVVYGMPQAAMNAGAVRHELAIDQIAPAIRELFSRTTQR